jgi:hypothetical protein
MTFLATVILGVFNYRINSEIKEIKKIKGINKSILKNTLGFLELEKKYSEAYAEKTGETSGSIKMKFRKKIENRINSNFTSEQKIRNLIEQNEKI